MPDYPRLSELPDAIPIKHPGDEGFDEYVDQIIDHDAALAVFRELARRRLSQTLHQPNIAASPVLEKAAANAQ